MQKEIFIQGIKKDSSEKELEKTIKKVFLESTNNLSWLSKGDSVLLKPALNSSDPYPATTHPLSIKVVAEILKQKGAKVIVADQSGIEHVLCNETGIIHGSSKKCFIESGMSKSNIEFTALEERGWNSYFKFKSPSWKNGFYITDLVRKVDHIINLPRLSTHGMTGVTLGFKNMVGLLRQDSRIEFHSDGPLYNIAKKHSKKSNLKNDFEKEGKFFEKITEISLAIKEKLRLTLFTGTEAQVTLGPDKRVTPLAESLTIKPETGIVFASSNPLATEMIAIAFLEILYSKVPLRKKLIQKLLITINNQIKELGKENIWENPFIKNALELKLGEKEFSIKYQNIPENLKQEIEKRIK